MEWGELSSSDAHGRIAFAFPTCHVRSHMGPTLPSFVSFLSFAHCQSPKRIISSIRVGEKRKKEKKKKTKEKKNKVSDLFKKVPTNQARGRSFLVKVYGLRQWISCKYASKSCVDDGLRTVGFHPSFLN